MSADEPTTYFERAIVDPDAPGGRFAKQVPSRVTGAGPVVPPLPASSPWARDPVPPEEPIEGTSMTFGLNVSGASPKPKPEADNDER